MYERHLLADSGSTGNNTHDGLEVGGTYDAVAFHFVVEAVGGAPTVTWKVQGSVDGSNWFDVAYVTDATDTAAVAGRAITAVGAQVAFLSNPVARKYKQFRLVTSANNNVTYRAEAWLIN